MGENMHTSFKHNLKYQNWPVFARDQIAEDVIIIIQFKTFKIIKLK